MSKHAHCVKLAQYSKYREYRTCAVRGTRGSNTSATPLSYAAWITCRSSLGELPVYATLHLTACFGCHSVISTLMWMHTHAGSHQKTNSETSSCSDSPPAHPAIDLPAHHGRLHRPMHQPLAAPQLPREAHPASSTNGSIVDRVD
jgi:hypothetical protein